jgi:hypothetical protein
MIETWLQANCDECSEPFISPLSCMTLKEFRLELKKYKWIRYKKQDYCPDCSKTLGFLTNKSNKNKVLKGKEK